MQRGWVPAVLPSVAVTVSFWAPVFARHWAFPAPESNLAFRPSATILGFVRSLGGGGSGGCGGGNCLSSQPLRNSSRDVSGNALLLLQATQLPGSFPILQDRQLTCPLQENEHDPQSSSPEEVYCGPSALVRGLGGGGEDFSGAVACVPSSELHNDELEGQTNI